MFFWKKKVVHEKGQSENMRKQGQLMDESHRGSRRDGYEDTSKRVRLGKEDSSSGTGKREEKAVESLRLVKTMNPMLLNEKDRELFQPGNPTR